MEDDYVKYDDDETLAMVSPSYVGEFVIPDGVTTIENEAFRGCDKITSVKLPDSVTYIGLFAFEGCRGLKEPVYNKNIFAYMPRNFSGSYKIPSGIKRIEQAAFHCCEGLTSIEIPDSVNTIGESAFAYCSKLTHIVIPNSVKSIDGFAFNECTGLKSIRLSDKLRCIEMGMFQGCTALETVEIPDSVTELNIEYIENYECFKGCESLKSPVFNKHVFVYMPQNYSGEYEIPSGISTIGDFAFADCYELKSVILPDSVKTINALPFYCCNSIEKPIYNKTIFAKMPNNATGNYIIPDGIEEIAGEAFADCDELTSIEIPDSVNKIGGMAFWYCDSIREINIPDSVEEIGDWAFNGNDERLRINVGKGNKNYCSINGSLYSKDMRTLFRYCKNEACEFVAPDSLWTIAIAAFEGVTNMRRIVLQEGVEFICKGAFSNSEVDAIYIPSSIKEINTDAFKNCKVKELHIKCIDINNVSVSMCALRGCDKDLVLYVPKGSAELYRNHKAFKDCKEIVEE